MVKTVTNINNNTITFDTDKYIIDKLKITNICDSSDSTGSSGDSIVADGNGGWSWGPGGGSGVPEGSSGDVIISDGSSGLDSTNILNVNPTNGTITGTGALTVVGGVGISGNLNVGGNVGLSSSLGIVIDYDTEHQISYNSTHFGTDVALSRDGKSMAVGSPRTGGGRPGAVYVYTRTDLTQSWTQKGSGAVIIGSIGDAQQGTSVAISDDGNIVAGIGLVTYENAVKVGRYSGNAWTTTSFSLSFTQSQFSYPVIHLNASGNILLIALDGDSSDGTGGAHGSVWIYEYNSSTSTWETKGQKITGNTSVTNDRLGEQLCASLSKDGLTFSVGRTKQEDGNKGEITVYDWNGTSWVPKGLPITGTSNDNLKKNALSDDGLTIVCGSRTNFSSVLVFVWSGSQWVQKGADIPNPMTWSTYLAISGDGNKLSLAAPFGSNNFINIYEYTNNLWTVSKTIQNGSDTFGFIMSFTYDGKNIATSVFGASPSILYTYSTAPDYGTAGQFLKSNGPGSAVSWDTPVDTTYINGSNMSLVGTEFNIPQSVATTASPSFTALTLGNTGTNQGVINLQDVTNTGRDTVANIKGFKDGTNGGDLQFFTKVDGGNVTPKLRINNEGKLGFRGANYGTANQYLKNNASGLPEWTTVTSVSQAPLDTPVVATPSGTGNVTLTSGSGYNTLLTFTPPDTVTNATNSTNASVLVGGHNVVCVSAPPLGGGGSGVPYLYSTAGLGYVPVNDVHVYFADYANKCPILTGVFDVYTAIVNNTNYLHSNRMVGGYQNDNLHVYGCHRASTTSDDRLKHNEVIITNGLEIARKLVPKAYDMTEEMLIKDYTGDLENSKRGSGFIAQELLEIPELSHAVQENSDPENTPYRVNYAETIAYAFAAIKELDAIVHTLQARIDVLESR